MLVGSKYLLVMLITILISYVAGIESKIYSTKLIHRYSNTDNNKTTKDHIHTLLNHDLKRQERKLKMKMVQKSTSVMHQLLFPSQGSQTMSFGNDLGWLHYMWIDIGTPSVTFLVAVDDGSDLLWVPCDCVQCAPLSSTYYSALDKDLNQYNPLGSSTGKHLPCSHQLCELGPKCKSATEPCPYNEEYFSENTASSGMLVQDILHLSSSSSNSSDASVQASVIFGCGKKQSGNYLDGIAPDGLMGLGLGEISVPSLLAKSGLVRNSFSLCFNDDGSGRIFFGDQGLNIHHWTPILPYQGHYSTYIVGVDAVCIGKSSCLQGTSFHALIDSGTSFTFLPANVYEKVVQQFDKEVKASRTNFDGYPWDYCYASSEQERQNFPQVRLMLQSNESFMIQDPLFPVSGDEGPVGYCLALQPSEGDIATIGQNYMTRYRLVFDRENLKFGWSQSNCEDLSDGKGLSLTPDAGGRATSPLPTNEQQTKPGGHAVAPAIAGRAPTKKSAASRVQVSLWMPFLILLPFLGPFYLLRHIMA